jgi:hypothetical protein
MVSVTTTEESTIRRAGELYPKGHDVLLNQANLVIGRNTEGFTDRTVILADGSKTVIASDQELFSLVHEVTSLPEVRDKFIELNPELYNQFKKYLKEVVLFRRAVAKHLEAIIEAPDQFIDEPGFDWRPTQKDCLSNCAWALKHGYQRLPFEVPTGGVNLIF